MSSRRPIIGFCLVLDPNPVADADHVIELNDVPIAHADATGAGGRSQLFLVPRSMDINVAIIGIHFAPEVFARLQSAEPKDPASDQVVCAELLRGKFTEMPPGRDPGAKNHACGLTIADTFGDFVESSRRAERILNIRRRTLRSRDYIALYEQVIFKKLQGLRGNSDQK